MSDVIARLRDPMVDIGFDDRLLVAEELERLRAALQKIAYPEWGEYPSDEMIVKAVVRIARAALTKHKP
jgi:hypothetical protein